jgi:hypothetical protein
MHAKLKIDAQSLVNLTLAVDWQSARVTHRDSRVFEKFNVWRDLDLLPDIMQKNLPGQSTGYQAAFTFEPQSLLPVWRQNNIHTMAPQQFSKTLRNGFTIRPHSGRFYPKCLLSQA